MNKSVDAHSHIKCSSIMDVQFKILEIQFSTLLDVDVALKSASNPKRKKIVFEC